MESVPYETCSAEQKEKIACLLQGHEPDHLQLRVDLFSSSEAIVGFHRPLNRLYFLAEGKAKITVVHEDGSRSIVHFVHPEDWIGELTLIGIEKAHKDVIAIGPCKCLSVPMDIARELLLPDADFLLMMSRYIGRKLLERTQFQAKQQRFALKYRLASYILLTEQEGLYREKHTETAEYLGVSYRHLLHTFEQFREERLIEKKGRGYTINPEGLKLLAERLD